MADKSKDEAFTQQTVSTQEEPKPVWPPNEEFPLNIAKDLNISGERTTVLQEVIRDSNCSENYLAVTGYTSLGHIVDFFSSKVDFSKMASVCIVFGIEPDIRRRESWGRVNFEKEIKDYWLEQGYSLLKGGNIIKMMSLIEANKVQFKILDRLHAKIYVGDNHAILGSSNFSRSGLTQQFEANIKVAALANDTSKQQYKYITSIAKNYYGLARDYKEGIIDLLKKLIDVTSWQEALARAIAEILGCSWFKEFPELYEKLNTINLWPIQREGLGQAIYTLQTQGCVLVADPTGSGKTKLISTLQILLFHWLWETGRKNKSNILVICPPVVQSNWFRESLDIGFAQNHLISMGLLSHSYNSKFKDIEKAIKAANVLVLDEAHNYLNLSSNRSGTIARHTVDYVILVTATPISRRPRDLLRLIELLDVDNLDDDELQQLNKLKNSRSLKDAKDFNNLRNYIKKFMVRRTKKQFKEAIQQEPNKYKNRYGELCKYPKTSNRVYQTGETEKDKLAALKITELAKQLKGVLYLKRLEKPDYFEGKEEAYIDMKLKAAQALSVYNVQAKLRSSRAALIELVEGTEAALDYFKFSSSKSHSGNFIQKIEKCKTKLPINEFSPETLPTWLIDLEEYQKACDHEIKVYSQITQVVKQISGKREKTKVKKLASLFKNNSLVIAFDSTIITLDYLKSLIAEQFTDLEVCVVTGQTTKETALRKFELGSHSRNILGLFSDCMSEGVNLQQVSALLFLDMPSILRVAEQRIGRIDRLDSPHKRVHIFWPSDSEEFALRTDRNLIKTSMDAKGLIGLNFSIPNEILDKHMSDLIQPEEMAEALEDFEQKDYIWEGIQDPFQPVHALYEREDPLISKEDYLYFQDVNAAAKVKISILESAENWVFMAIRGSKAHPPRWYFIDSNDCIYSELPEICRQLRQRLNSLFKTAKWTDETEHCLKSYAELLQKNEIHLLPNKRRRALEVAKFILEEQLKTNQDADKDKLYKLLLELFEPSSVDSESSINYYLFSQQWLDVLNPYLFEKRYNRRYRNQIISLNDLKEESHNVRLNKEKLEQIINNLPYTQPLRNNISACIIGICKEETFKQESI